MDGQLVEPRAHTALVTASFSLAKLAKLAIV